MMDKRTFLAFILIGAIFLVWSLVFNPSPSPEEAGAVVDTIGAPVAATAPAATPAPQQAPSYSGIYTSASNGEQKFITIESPLYKAVLSTKGALLYRFQLTQYKTWYGDPVQLISDSVGFPGELGLAYKTNDGREISTRDLYFQVDGPDSISLGESDSVTITARLILTSPTDSTGGLDTTNTPQRMIEKRFTFYGNKYALGFDVAMQNMVGEISGNAYTLDWKDGLMYQEHNSVEESSKAKLIASINDEHVEFDATEVGVPKQETFTGNIAWIGSKTKYFGAALVPAQPLGSASVTATGSVVAVDSSGHVEHYGYALNVPYGATADETKAFTLFIGPLDYDVTKQYGLEDMVDFGWELIVRPIGEFVMLPIFRFLHGFIGNYGIVIIVFSILIRLVLWPLSIPQIKSSRKMQLLQPKVTELREKNKDNSQEAQMAMMALYREYGVNPVSGCLPLILQLPILYALWATLSNAIDLRQAGFGLWIHDLSIPDTIITLPFSLPLLGSHLSGLALVMGISLFFQQKLMITDPKQKALIYFMPIFLTITFNALPSGLNLYYLVFNVLSIGQHLYITKYSKNTITLDDLKEKAKNKKKGWLAQKMEEAQKMAEMQGRTVPGQSQKNRNGSTKTSQKK